MPHDISPQSISYILKTSRNQAGKQSMMERRSLRVSGKTALLASIAGLIIGGPLIGLMGISFLATMTLLLVTSPLFIIFSPVLFGAACVLGLAMIGFAVAGTMAVAGVSAVTWVLRSFTSRRGVQYYGGGRGVTNKLIKSGGDAEGKDRAGYIQQKPYYPRADVGELIEATSLHLL